MNQICGQDNQIIYIVIGEGATGEGSAECWICYDTERTDAGPLIQPCDCRGDVGAVHHHCLRKWLMEVRISNVLLSVLLMVWLHSENGERRGIYDGIYE